MAASALTCWNRNWISLQVVTTQPGSVHVYRDNSQVNSTGPLIFSIIVAVCCGICVPLTLVCSIPAIIFAALVRHNNYELPVTKSWYV